MTIFIRAILIAHSQFYLFFSTSFTIFLSIYLSSNWEAQGQELRGKIMSALKFLLLYVMLVLSRAEYLKCPTHQQHFEKIIGYRPSINYDLNMRNINTDVIPDFQQLNTLCWSLCYKDANCYGYVYFVSNSSCTGYSIMSAFDDPYYIKHQKLLLSADSSAVFFQKICLRVPDDCQQKMWHIARYPKAQVLPQEFERSEKLMSRLECVESCLHETKSTCRSLIFIPSSRNNFIRSGNRSPFFSKDVGQCVLSTGTIRSPIVNGTTADNSQSLDIRMEYIENQCIDQWETVDETPSECSFEKYYNRSFIYADSAYQNLSLEDCQVICFQQDLFFCKGISYVEKGLKCLLHSDDISTFGDASLTHSYGSVYMRRVECLNVSIACMDDEIVVKYYPTRPFYGKMYLNSRYGNCSTQENRDNTVKLNIPFGEEIQENVCGIVRAYEMRNDVNRTLISTYLIIQKNPSARTLNDRVIKIGCVVNNNEILKPNSTLRLSRKQSSRKLNIEATTNTYEESKNRILSNQEFKFAKMELFDTETRLEISEVSLGQWVELKISGDSIGDRFGFRVINLTAISDSNEEILLLDERGCPGDPTIMSVFQSGKTNNISWLSSKFRVFKFSDTPRVIFHIILQICKDICTQPNCLAMPMKDKRVQYFTDGNDTEVFEDIASSPTHMDLMFPEIFHKFQDNSIINRSNERDDDSFIGSSEIQYQRILASLDSEESEDRQPSRDNIYENYKLFFTILNFDFMVNTDDAKSESFVYGSEARIANETEDPIPSSFKFEDLICVDTTFLKIFFSFFILLLVVIICVSYCCIRRYRRMSLYDNNSSLSNNRPYLPKFLQGNRKNVKWADENFGFVY
ncbi:hypothetical protein DMENIID0001_101820 [Sergentomyia squamirostris]